MSGIICRKALKTRWLEHTIQRTAHASTILLQDINFIGLSIVQRVSYRLYWPRCPILRSLMSPAVSISLSPSDLPEGNQKAAHKKGLIGKRMTMTACAKASHHILHLDYLLTRFPWGRHCLKIKSFANSRPSKPGGRAKVCARRRQVVFLRIERMSHVVRAFVQPRNQ